MLTKNVKVSATLLVILEWFRNIIPLEIIYGFNSDAISFMKYSSLYFCCFQKYVTLTWIIVSYEQCFTSLLLFCLANWRKGLAENHRQFPDRLFVLEFASPMETVTSAACHSHHAASLTTTLDPSSLCYLFIYTVIGHFQVRWAIKSPPWGFWSVCLTIFNKTSV